MNEGVVQRISERPIKPERPSSSRKTLERSERWRIFFFHSREYAVTTLENHPDQSDNFQDVVHCVNASERTKTRRLIQGTNHRGTNRSGELFFKLGWKPSTNSQLNARRSYYQLQSTPVVGPETQHVPT
ncbi:hypothetical protein PM082_016956 [Marasmius tenuissimus]|nr:hypothetical protein PM082_016956 [Marasmius tenuissimus]